MNLICVHILAADILDLDEKTIAEKLKSFKPQSTQMVIFVRDINLLTRAQFDEYKTRVDQVLKDPWLASTKFLPVTQVIQEEQNFGYFQDLALQQDFMRASS